MPLIGPTLRSPESTARSQGNMMFAIGFAASL
jgi:hypothetical protein